MALDDYLAIGWFIITFIIVVKEVWKYVAATSIPFAISFSLTIASGTAVIFQNILRLFLNLFPQ